MFAQKIKELRLKRGLTQAYLAGQFGVQQQTVNKWEKGIAYPNIETLKEIAKFFNISIDYLLDNEPTDVAFLTEERARLVNSYEELTPDGKNLIWNTLRVLLAANRQQAPLAAPA